MNAKIKASLGEAEIKNLLDDWIRARRSVWDAFFGLVNANTPAPWREIVERSTVLYEQMMESVLEAQAATLTATLRAFGPANSMSQLVAAWDEGMRPTTETAAETQRKSEEVRSKELVEQRPTITEKKAHAPSKAA
jgi:hypothetical protein